ncbi:MAG TPA: putative toxin-antitoxin system toxin component, PIN family [Thermomicrobiales bacterium]
MPDVVFDTVVFIRSLINPHGLWGRLVFARDDYRLIISEPVLREITEVLARPQLRRKYRSIPTRDPFALLSILTYAHVVDVKTVPAISRDPKDDKFLATVYAASADYLVTEDQDLLILQEYEGTQIVTAAQFVAILDVGRSSR